MESLLINPDFWKSLSAILWPIVVLIMFFAGKSLIKSLFAKDQISIEVAGMKLNVADAAKNIGKDLADLQQKVASIEEAAQQSIIKPAAGAIIESPQKADTKRPLSIIWVDDYPSNNAFLVDRLQQDGVSIELSLSTTDALGKIRARKFDAVLSDLGRQEDGQEKPMAGLDLIKSIRADDKKIPILIYAGSRGLDNKHLLLDAGANIVTTSGTEVAKFVKNLQRSISGKP